MSHPLQQQRGFSSKFQCLFLEEGFSPTAIKYL